MAKKVMEIRMLRNISLALLCCSLSGCFVAPGMRMENVPETGRSARAACAIHPCFVPIDTCLIRQLEHCGNDISNSRIDSSYYYHVGPHDILNVYVWEHPEFGSPLGQAAGESGMNANINPTLAASGFLVGPDGNIFFPMIGYIHVEGKTVDEIRSELMRLLTKYVRKPQIDVRVVGFRSKKIYVMGEVHKPGIQPLTDTPMSITDVINIAGGLNPDSADPSHIFVIRGDMACPTVYWLNAQSPSALLLAENFHLKPHDIIFVSTANVVRWNRAMSQILPTIQTAWFTRTLIRQR